MNGKEIALIAEFLEEYSDKVSMAVCNDWSFPDEWSQDERARFVWEYHQWNGDPEEYDENRLSLPDFAVVSFLAHKLSKARIEDD